MLYYLAISLTIFSNIIYHVTQKLIPPKANPFLVLTSTYLTAAFLSLLLSPVSKGKAKFVFELSKLNWVGFALGIAIFGLELGFLLAYRAGWKISTAALFSNAAVSLFLIPIGILFFGEKLTVTKVLGIIFCLIGLWLLG
ncbi:EamA family transporter [Carboxydothermus ferrireducens]|uniref:Drug/metabolite transporter (DMT)-like permease n=1 Tax=Carboxydothermus ferrireducens DSM 11255 TaxID=1119529 RepID=A0ABX2R5E4_9THEO|nr:EamA family transporter [Carboxydothermus ferrireducens]NYE56386.1 drug/metabolite transporter (DMT)-like permease [Carboxydothermus ferrireducens DSM 11255]